MGEGIASFEGHPLDKGNEHFAILFKEHFGGSYNKYTAIPNERLIKVMPTFITLWEYIDGKPRRLFFDFKEEKAYMKHYEYDIQ